MTCNFPSMADRTNGPHAEAHNNDTPVCVCVCVCVCLLHLLHTGPIKLFDPQGSHVHTQRYMNRRRGPFLYQFIHPSLRECVWVGGTGEGEEEEEGKMAGERTGCTLHTSPPPPQSNIPHDKNLNTCCVKCPKCRGHCK